MARLEIDIVGNNTELKKILADSKIALSEFSKSVSGAALADGLKVARVETQNARTEAVKLASTINTSLAESLNNAKVRTEGAKQATEGYKQSVLEAKTSVEQGKQAITDSNVALKNQQIETEKSRTATQNAKRALAELNLENKKNKQSVDAAVGSYREAQLRLTALGKSIREAGMGFDLSNPKVKAAVAEYNRLNNQLKEFDKAMGNHQRNVGNYGSAFSAISPRLGALTTGLGALGLASTTLGSALNSAKKTLFSFDSGLKSVEKTTGLSAREVSKLGEVFVGLSRQLQVVSPVKLTEYATVAGQLGVKGTKDITAFTESLAKLETASNITGEQGGAEIARMLTLVDGGVQNVKKFSDEIVNLGNNFPATEKEILANAEAIAQNVGVYKIGRQEVLAFATATKSVGIEAELVGSTFNRTLAIFERAIRTGDGLSSIISLIGGNQASLSKRFKEDASGVFVDFIGSLNKIYKSGGSVNEQLEKIGVNAVRDQRVIQSLAANGYDVLTSSLDTVRNATGALDREFATQSDSLTNNVNKITVAWEGLILSIDQGDGVISKTTRGMASYFASLLNSATDLVNSSSWKEAFAPKNLSISPIFGMPLGGFLKNEAPTSSISPQDFMKSLGGNNPYNNRGNKSTGAIEEQSNALIKNKQYWDDQVKSIRGSIEAMDSSLIGSARYLELQKQLGEAEAQSNAYKAITKTQLNDIKRKQEEYNKAIADATKGALNQYDQKLFDINDKYNKLYNIIGKTSEKGLLAQQSEEAERLRVRVERVSDLIKGLKFGKIDLKPSDLKNASSINISDALPNLDWNKWGIDNRRGVTTFNDDTTALEKRMGKVIERGLRNGIDGIFGDIDDLGSNFYEVFSNVFGKLSKSVTSMFQSVLATQLGDLLSTKINDKDFSIAGLDAGKSKALIAGIGTAGSLISGLTSKKSVAGQALGGAASGAAAGLAFGPYGAAVGAVIGGLAGMFSAQQANKQSKIQEEMLKEQRKQTALQERANALAYTASIIGQQTTAGIVTGVDRNAFGEITFRVGGRDLVAVLGNEENAQKRGL